MSQDVSQFVNWNPKSKVVIDRRTGEIHHGKTNEIRARLGLPTPWTPAIGVVEANHPPIDWAPKPGAVPPPPAAKNPNESSPSPGVPPMLITPTHDEPDDPFEHPIS